MAFRKPLGPFRSSLKRRLKRINPLAKQQFGLKDMFKKNLRKRKPILERRGGSRVMGTPTARGFKKRGGSY